MPPKIPTKLGRLTVLFIAVTGVIIAILALALLACESVDPAESALWHMRHGNTITFDGHLFHLPLSWYPEPVTTPGELSLRHAQFGRASVSSIALAIYPKNLDDQAAKDRVAAMTGSLNKYESNSNPWTAETLRGRRLTFHCTMSTLAGTEESLICQAADSNLTVITLAVGPTARAQALDIIETSE